MKNSNLVVGSVSAIPGIFIGDALGSAAIPVPALGTVIGVIVGGLLTGSYGGYFFQKKMSLAPCAAVGAITGAAIGTMLGSLLPVIGTAPSIALAACFASLCSIGIGYIVSRNLTSLHVAIVSASSGALGAIVLGGIGGVVGQILLLPDLGAAVGSVLGAVILGVFAGFIAHKTEHTGGDRSQFKTFNRQVAVISGVPGAITGTAIGRLIGSVVASGLGILVGGVIGSSVGAFFGVAMAYMVASKQSEDSEVSQQSYKMAGATGAMAGAKGGASIGAAVGLLVGTPDMLIGAAVGAVAGALLVGVIMAVLTYHLDNMSEYETSNEVESLQDPTRAYEEIQPRLDKNPKMAKISLFNLPQIEQESELKQFFKNQDQSLVVT